MSKIMLAILTAAAFLYAVYLVIFRRQLPNPKQSAGLKKRFILATLLFVGLLGTVNANGRKLTPDVMCYDITPTVTPQLQQSQMVLTLKAVWRTLDPNRSQEFRNKLEKAAAENLIRKKTADMLAIAYAETAYHKQRIRATCYRMGPSGHILYRSRENILKQIAILGNARKSGKIDEQTCKKSLMVLAREVEMLYRAKDPTVAKDRTAQEKINEEYKANKLIASDSATIAAKLIVEMEDVKITDLTPAKRLAAMKDRVQTLLLGGKKSYVSGGPTGNDWMDPAINPNVYAVLEKAGIIPVRGIMVTCYDRSAAPVKARSEELKKLQQQLLDKNIKAGVLDVEVAEKAASAPDGKDIDYATETDIRNYQNKVRRAIRMLYKHGELPSSFVEKIEYAADVEIISFDPSKALRNDVQWHIRSLFWRSVGDDIIIEFEKRKIIPKARNHRMMMDWSWHNKNNEHTEYKNKELERFTALLDSKEHLVLDADKNTTIKKKQLPQADLDYRLEIRRICRVLLKTGLVDQNRLKSLEEVIGIPIIGTIEK